jgi:hypothetical protein
MLIKVAEGACFWSYFPRRYPCATELVVDLKGDGALSDDRSLIVLELILLGALDSGGVRNPPLPSLKAVVSF